MKRILVLACLLSLPACAVVIRGTKETARFESYPSGAKVTAVSVSEDKLGSYSCVTPCELELKRKRSWNVEFALDGYKEVSGVLSPKVTGGGVASGVGNGRTDDANLGLRPNPMQAELVTRESAGLSRILPSDDGAE